jgi:hypothetical protein
MLLGGYERRSFIVLMDFYRVLFFKSKTVLILGGIPSLGGHQ